MKFPSIFSLFFIPLCAIVSFMAVYTVFSTVYTIYPTKIAEAQELAQGPKQEDVKLEVKLIEAKSRLINNYLVESVFEAKIKAYGGDIILPAYREDIVSKPVFMTETETSNAIIPSTATVKVEKRLPSLNGKYVLREGEETNITVTVTSKVIQSALTSPRIVFKIALSSLIWKPVIQEINEDEAGNPILDVSLLGWETNPVMVFRDTPFSIFSSVSTSNSTSTSIITSTSTDTTDDNSADSKQAKQTKPKRGLANVISIFRQIGQLFSRSY